MSAEACEGAVCVQGDVECARQGMDRLKEGEEVKMGS